MYATDSDFALAAAGVGRLVSEYFNQQNMDLLTLMQAGKDCLKLIEAAQQELTHGDEGNIERTVRGKKEDFISFLEAFYWSNALTCENKGRNAMTRIIDA